MFEVGQFFKDFSNRLGMAQIVGIAGVLNVDFLRHKSLKLDGICLGSGSHIDKLFGPIQPAIVIATCLGNDKTRGSLSDLVLA
jgi:hypothetical protein